MPHRQRETAGGNRSAYVGTAKIEDIDTPKMILLIGTNPRVEAPVLNARIRKAWTNGAKIGLIGEAVDLTYDYKHVGTDRAALVELVGRDHREARSTLVIIGQGAINEADGEAVLSQAMAYVPKTAGAKLLVLHTAAARVGAMDVGAVTEGGLAAATEGAEVIYNLGADEVDIAAGPS
jgi:NADH-quinone oxidoreductase subunit G